MLFSFQENKFYRVRLASLPLRSWLPIPRRCRRSRVASPRSSEITDDGVTYGWLHTTHPLPPPTTCAYVTAADGQVKERGRAIAHHPGERVHVQPKVLKSQATAARASAIEIEHDA